MKTELRGQVNAQLNLPNKREANNPDKDLARNLGDFLVDEGFISEIGINRGSWGYKYENKAINISGVPMPKAQYDYYIFRLGRDPNGGKELFPLIGDETDQYRFLHEVGHAYQDYLIHQESPDNPEGWYDRVLADGGVAVNSNFELLFRYCFKKRVENPGKGLSTWGNVPDYESVQDQASQYATRAVEDANELIVMYLWNPQYLRTFLDYLSGKIPGYGDANLQEDGLIKISAEEVEALKLAIEEYIAGMKQEISK